MVAFEILKLCSAARVIVRDATSNEVSAFKVLEEISLVGLPALLPDVQALAMFVKEEADVRTTFR